MSDLSAPAARQAIRDAAHALERAAREQYGEAMAPVRPLTVEDAIAAQFAHAPDWTEFRTADGTTFIRMPGGGCMVSGPPGVAGESVNIVRYTTHALDSRCPR